MMKIFKKIILIILTVLLLLSTTLLLILIPVRNTISKKSIKDALTNVELENIVEDNPKVKEKVDEILKPICDETGEFGIDDEVIIKIFDSKEVKGLLGDISSNVLDYVIYKKNQKIINVNDIEKLISSVIDDINNSGIYSISDNNKENIVNIVKEEFDKYQNIVPDTSVVNNYVDIDDNVNIEIVRFILSNNLIIYLSIVIIVSFIGIVLLKLKNLKWLKHNLVVILISDIISIIISSIILILNNIYLKTYYDSNIINNYFNFSFKLYISILLIIIILLSIYKVYKKNKIKSS